MKTDSDAKISKIEAKYSTTSDYNKFTGEIVNTKIKEKGLVGKCNIYGFKNYPDLDKKIEKRAEKAELKKDQDWTVKVQAFYFSWFCGKTHLEDDGMENYLVFQPVYSLIKNIANNDHTCESKVLNPYRRLIKDNQEIYYIGISKIQLKFEKV